MSDGNDHARRARVAFAAVCATALALIALVCVLESGNGSVGPISGENSPRRKVARRGGRGMQKMFYSLPRLVVQKPREQVVVWVVCVADMDSTGRGKQSLPFCMLCEILSRHLSWREGCMHELRQRGPTSMSSLVLSPDLMATGGERWLEDGRASINMFRVARSPMMKAALRGPPLPRQVTHIPFPLLSTPSLFMPADNCGGSDWTQVASGMAD